MLTQLLPMLPGSAATASANCCAAKISYGDGLGTSAPARFIQASQYSEDVT